MYRILRWPNLAGRHTGLVMTHGVARGPLICCEAALEARVGRWTRRRSGDGFGRRRRGASGRTGTNRVAHLRRERAHVVLLVHTPYQQACYTACSGQSRQQDMNGAN
jgi:hypothetical protein